MNGALCLLVLANEASIQMTVKTQTAEKGKTAAVSHERTRNHGRNNVVAQHGGVGSGEAELSGLISFACFDQGQA